MDTIKKDAFLQVRINTDLKKAFDEKCKERYSDKTAVLTTLIVKYVNNEIKI